MGLLAWGEGWHNNHHAFPYSAAFGLRWYQIDPGLWLIRSLEAVGLVWNVKVPSPDKIARRLVRRDKPDTTVLDDNAMDLPDFEAG